jgi:hypothetical protein
MPLTATGFVFAERSQFEPDPEPPATEECRFMSLGRIILQPAGAHKFAIPAQRS